ncbi:Hemicentin-1 [Gossypium arboreum]|uniref:Hemicentin-1 n=1 Tax=Gossypium arboreum TaxID=29729 RepID=A0A0B0MS36_GOSAR|nr:Hemicentin-1 [Gossypium arboreum]
MSGTCIGHILKVSVRPCLGHGIGLICVSLRPCLGHGIGLDI